MLQGLLFSARVVGSHSCIRGGWNPSLGVHVKVDFRGLSSDCDMQMCPSSDRDGLRVAFECERCGKIEFLVVEQSEGRTALYWEAEGNCGLSVAPASEGEGSETA